MRYFSLVITLFLWGAALFAAEPHKALRASAVHLPNGSGSIVQSPHTKKKYVITNWHVCNDYTVGQFRLGKKQYEGAVIKSDPIHDLCAIELKDQSLPALSIADKAPHLGDRLVTRGWPRGDLKESEGVVQAFEQMAIDFAGEVRKCPKGLAGEYTKNGHVRACVGVYDYVHTTLFCEPGSSGSGVVNEAGELVGVIQTWEGPENLRSAGVLPLSYVLEFFQSL